MILRVTSESDLAIGPPMSLVCQHCKDSRATVHITDVMPDQRERHLCQNCAEKEGIIIKQHALSTNAILQQFMKHNAAQSVVEDLSCPKCGMSFREFQLKGQLGCPNDYQVFSEVLSSLIERAHEGATHHVGKSPVTAEAAVRKQTGLLRLQRALRAAVEDEDYEVAARVRDQIRVLESP